MNVFFDTLLLIRIRQCDHDTQGIVLLEDVVYLLLKMMMMMTQGLSLGALAPCQVVQTLPGRLKILPCSLLASTQQQLRRSGAPANLRRCVLFDFLRNAT